MLKQLQKEPVLLVQVSGTSSYFSSSRACESLMMRECTNAETAQ